MLQFFPFLAIAGPKAYLVESNTGKIPGTNKDASASSAGESEVKRDSKGRMVVVRHKSRSISVKGGGSCDKLALADVKKWIEESEKSAKKEGKKDEEKKDGAAGEKKAGGWTKEEDEKLIEYKKGTGAWAKIAEELGRPVEEVKNRWNQDLKNREPKAEEGKTDAQTGDGPKNSNGNKKGGDDNKADTGKQGQQTMDKSVFTPEEDGQLKKLMADGKTIKECAKTLKKPQNIIEKRWAEIGGDEKSNKTKSDSGKKEEKANEEAKKASSKKSVSKAGSIRSEVKFTLNEWMTLQEDDLFTFQELKLIATIMAKNPQHSWLGVASLFYDETGRRVHPEDMRDKFLTIADMR
jgi:hypothetical protein